MYHWAAAGLWFCSSLGSGAPPCLGVSSVTNVAKPCPMAPASSCLPVTLIEELSCAGPAKALRKLHGKCLSQLQPLPQTLQAWALLQLDGPPRLCRAARTRLASAARNKRFREKVINFGVIHLTIQLARLTGLTPKFCLETG